MHRQAQNHNGAFKYAFAAENGLSQGEVIAPDGTRNGGYTYIDPHGKKISVKYTAGKDGFKILEGDHIPMPVPAAHLQEPQNERKESNQEEYHQDQTPYQSRPQQQPYQAKPAYHAKPVYQGKPYQPPKPVYQPKSYQPQSSYSQGLQPHQGQYKPQYTQFRPEPNYSVNQPKEDDGEYRPEEHEKEGNPQESGNSVEQAKEPEYHDEPGKPFSFGKGYFFQFGG